MVGKLCVILFVCGFLSTAWGATPSPTGTGTPSPPAPVTGLASSCFRPYPVSPPTIPVTFACLTWDGPPVTAYYYTGSIAFYTLTWSTGGVVVGTNSPIYATMGVTPVSVATGLTGDTTYTFSVTATNEVGLTSAASTIDLTTSPDDARSNYEQDDIHDIVCTAGISSTTGRTAITCTWDNPDSGEPQPSSVVVRGKCKPTGVGLQKHQKTSTFKKHLKGDPTTVTINVNRANAVCTVYIYAFYRSTAPYNHKQTRGRGHRSIVTVDT